MDLISALPQADASTVHGRLPRVVLSLDFELRWGVHHRYGLDFSSYRSNLEAVHDAVPDLLKMLAAHSIHATWAAVGALACESWEEYFSRAPQPPNYANPDLQVKKRYAELDPDGRLHFAPQLMRRISAMPGQELGTHTFSHLYLREEGVTAADVAADLAAVRELYAERFGIIPTSLVFPRNQYAFIDVVREAGIRMWRGNQAAWYYEREDTQQYGMLPKALKMLDELNPFCRYSAAVEEDMTRASLFLRLSVPPALWSLHIQRIKGELRALGSDEVFHIWFHPHNLGHDTRLRLARVEQVLELIAERQSRGQLVSCSMGELIH